VGCAYLPTTGSTWLFTEFLGGTLRAGRLPDGQGIVRAAAWIGAFHEASAPLSAGADLPFVHRLGAEDYLRCALAEPCTSVPWLRLLTDALTASARRLADGPQALLHGEFYPSNILIQGDDVRPVDWESAAFGAGEIDLAALTDRWPDEIAAAARDAYARARWGDGAPPEFAGRLAAARLFLDLRWLSQSRELQTEKRRRLLAKVADDVKAMGIL
jgi:aminoglycoside phosphotransferase (APT) family kinase protein